MIRLDDQVAIITGSGRGLGAAYARLLAERGAANPHKQTLISWLATVVFAFTIGGISKLR